MRPVEPRAGQGPNRASIQPGMHAVTVELDFVQPFRPVRRFVDELGELRSDPLGQTGHVSA
jgi:hypothetical protein